MTRQHEALAQSVSLICENCEHEFSARPLGALEVTCPKCGSVMDVSHFKLVVRKQRLAVSQNRPDTHWRIIRSNLELTPAPPTLRFQNLGSIACARQALLDLYRGQGYITLAQAMAVLVAFQAGDTEGLLRLLGYRDEATQRALRKGGWLTEEDSFGDRISLLDEMAGLEIKKTGKCAGRSVRPDTLILWVDAFLLTGCPNGYVDFLRDALTLRASEYRRRPGYAQAHQDAWKRFWRAKRCVEVTCQRIWRGTGNALGGETARHAPKGWWEPVARQQDLIG